MHKHERSPHHIEWSSVPVFCLHMNQMPTQNSRMRSQLVKQYYVAPSPPCEWRCWLPDLPLPSYISNPLWCRLSADIRFPRCSPDKNMKCVSNGEGTLDYDFQKRSCARVLEARNRILQTESNLATQYAPCVLRRKKCNQHNKSAKSYEWGTSWEID